jgi:hypothetical protein
MPPKKKKYLKNAQTTASPFPFHFPYFPACMLEKATSPSLRAVVNNDDDDDDRTTTDLKPGAEGAMFLFSLPFKFKKVY